MNQLWQRLRRNLHPDRLVVYVDASFMEARYAFTVENDREQIGADAGHIPVPGITSVWAEYQALNNCLTYLISRGYRRHPITVRSDCRNIVDMVNGIGQPNSANLRAPHAYACALIGAFDDLQVEWIPRDQNRQADRDARAGEVRILTP